MSASTSPSTSVGPEPDPSSAASCEPEVLRRQRELVRDVLRVVSQRAASESKVENTRATRDNTADVEYAKTRQSLVEKHQRLEREAIAVDEKRRRAIVEAAMSGEANAKGEFAAASRRIASEFDGLREAAKYEHARAKAEADSAFAVGGKQAVAAHAQAVMPIDEAANVADVYRERLAVLAADYRKLKLKADPPPPSRETYTRFADPIDELHSRLQRMGPPLNLAEELLIPRSIKGAREIWVYLLMSALLAAIGIAMGMEFSTIAGMAITGAALGGLARFGLVNLSRSQLERLYNPLQQSLADADGLAAHCRSVSQARFAEAQRLVANRHEEELRQARERHAKTIAEGESSRDEQLRKINEIYARATVEVQTAQARGMREAVDAHDRRLPELKAHAEASLLKLDESYRAHKNEIKNRHETSRHTLEERWRTGMGQAAAGLDEVARKVDSYGPAWDNPAWESRPLPGSLPPVVRFGEIKIDLAELPDGLPADPRLREGVLSRFAIPAIRPFPSLANLLVEAPPDGRAAAIELIQAQMFRLLTSLPPGMVRFTIIDPMGIGRSFGAFMHLADHDPALVSQQVWTDPRQIEERLAELCAHMEVVTQKYLRNEYASIEEYNAVAGEVAEPYRVLVIADFPSQFDEKAAARLTAIASGGVPCGVLILMAADPTRPMPPFFRLDDLRPHFSHLAWNGSLLAWDDPELGQFPLVLDAPPPVDFANRLVQKVGLAAKEAKRVEVPFEFIAPSENAWWTGDSRAGIDVALGKAGAMRRQNLTLGQGTSQHVLIAGRTGSGKSTLMHALITNLALQFSPDEIDLYLIDFKKGVEFKVYATFALPHASVVAIESEREFGISVLQRLDAELRLRADKFRDAGVQDLQGYRNTPGSPPMPRILLVVDEFQEFFVEEDRLAQEAALLLDRLVRQGRAFGVHVLLGSQSLGGAFTLARSTLGQMAVRIALQCSEADSHLILSENNLAAKLLSRPGEAIYNDANGAPEGNHFFQVVWLSDERRENYLRRIHEHAAKHSITMVRTPIVFEGDAPADLTRNPFLSKQLESGAWPGSPRSAAAWLGDAVAIKDPTSAVFRRQAGNHLLIVGQNEEAALGVVAASLISLATQYPPARNEDERFGARFLVLDGTPEDQETSGLLARLSARLSHGVLVGGWRDAARFLTETGTELTRRREGNADGPELFLLIHDLARFRDLRRREDDFSFSRREEDASPADHLDALLREGPPLGIHLVLWCDTVNNLNRHFTHQQLREFEMRVLFQMSPNDSGHLLDAPSASKLGPKRALFLSEEQNRLEKFRPYGFPPEGFLIHLGDQLARRPAPASSPS